jgi:phosphate transport system substrate-binding protein
MKMSWIVTAVLTAWLIAASTLCFAEELKIAAGSAPVENILKPVKNAFEEATKIQLIFLDTGPKMALDDLKRAKVDAAAAGFSFQEWLKLMAKEGVPIDDPSRLREVSIGTDRIAVITNKDNPVRKLTGKQLQGIFSGEIDNWKSVGGPDLPIIIVWGSLMQDDNGIFLGRFLKGKRLAPELLETTNAEAVRQNVAANPSAIGIGPSGIVDDSVSSPEIPEVSREITLVASAYAPDSVRKLIDFLKSKETGKTKRQASE